MAAAKRRSAEILTFEEAQRRRWFHGASPSTLCRGAEVSEREARAHVVRAFFGVSIRCSYKSPLVGSELVGPEDPMHLVEILLPMSEPGKFSGELERLSRLLTEKFGGMTAFVRSPGEGLWRDQGKTERDDVVVVEVMTEEVDGDWWRDLRTSLEARLRQKEIVIRAHAVHKL